MNGTRCGGLWACVAFVLVVAGCGEDAAPAVDTVQCRLNSDCPVGRSCQEGTCVEGCEGSTCPCAADADCPDGLLCASDAGICFVPACAEDVDCALGKVCARGRCETDTAADRDRDGVPDAEDRCPDVADTDQGDLDQDGQGDACDADDDNDGLADALDNCPRVTNPSQADADGDGQGNACDADTPATTVVGTLDRASSSGASFSDARVSTPLRADPVIPDTTGNFVFPDLLPDGGPFSVRVVWPGFVPLEQSFVAPPDMETFNVGALVMRSERDALGMELRGTVELEGRSDHEGIVVRAREGSTLVATTLTDRDGHYSVRAARLEHRVEFSREGYEGDALTARWDEAEQRFEVDEQPLDGLTVVLPVERSATLRARLVSAIGVTDWVARVTTASLVGEGRQEAVVVQADGGLTLVERVAPGAYVLRVEARGHLPLVRTVLLDRGETDLGDLELSPRTVEASGRARLAGLSEHSGILVRARLAGRVLDTTGTASDGAFALRTVEDDQELELSSPGYVSVVVGLLWNEADARFEVQGEPLATTDALVLQLNLGASLQGRLRTDVVPWDWASTVVRLSGLVEREFSPDRDGTLAQTQLAEGLYALTVSAPGHRRFERVVALGQGANDLGELVLEPLEVSLVGSVRLVGEQEHGGVTVRLRRDGRLEGNVVSERDGRFELRTLPLPAQLALSAPGFLDAAVEVGWDGEGFAIDGVPLADRPLTLYPQPQADRDGDGVPDAIDNCRDVSNPDQANLDAARERSHGLPVQGDVCDDDFDGDGIPNGLDVCPRAYDPMQESPGGTGRGIACDGIDLDRPFPIDEGVLRQVIDTRGRPDRLAGSCGGRGAPELVYELPLAAGETLTATVEARHNVAVYLLDPQGQELACQTRVRFEHQVEASGTYRLVVDGFSEVSAGPVRVDVPRPLPWTPAGPAVSRSLPTWQPYRLSAGDLDRDGVAEIMVAFFQPFFGVAEVREFHVRPDGVWTQGPRLAGLSGWTTNVHLVDLDLDGWLDVAATAAPTQNQHAQLHVVLNDHGALQPAGPQTSTPVGVDLAVPGAYFVRPDGAWFEDLNGDRLPDAVVLGEYVRQTGSDFEGLNYVAYVLPGRGDGTFEVLPGHVTFPRQVFGLWLGDLNGDGRVDLAASTFLESTLLVGLGRGNGEFDLLPEISVPYGPTTVVGEDVDGDGRTDLITSNLASQDGALLSGDGSGGFERRGLVLPGIHERMVGADLNGDRVQDLLLGARFESAVGAAVGRGDATFQAPLYAPLVDVHGDASIAVDLDDDGIGDIVTVDAQSGRLAVVPGSVPRRYRVWESVQSDADALRSGPTFVLSRDLDGDGQPELLVSNRTTNTVSVLSGGPGAWDTTTIDLRKADPGQQVLNAANLLLADFTDDGVDDLVVLHPTSDRISFLPGLSAGGFADSEVFDIFPRGQMPTGLVAIDVGGYDFADPLAPPDGRPDLLITTSNGQPGAAVLLNTGTGNHFSVCRGSNGGPCPMIAALRDHAIFDAEAIDLTGDGRDELVALETGPTPSIHIRDPGSRDLVAGELLTLEGPALGGCALPIQVRAVDVNLDGQSDLAVTCRALADQGSVPVVVLLRLGSGTDLRFGPPIEIVDVPGALTLEVADVTGDGLLDLVVAQDNRDAVAILRGDGTGHFEAHQTLRVSGSVLSTAVADLDGDGSPEIVLPAQQQGVLHIASAFGGAASPYLAGTRLTDVDAAPCPPGDVAGVLLDEGTIRFDVGEVAGCRVDRLELTLDVFEGADAAAWISLEAESVPVAGRRVELFEGWTPGSGRWRPQELGGLARFEGAAARGPWWLRATAGLCLGGGFFGAGCVPASVFAGATLHVNPPTPDPLAPLGDGEVRIPVCASAEPTCGVEPCPFGDLCRSGAPTTDLPLTLQVAGTWADAADADTVLIEGPGVGGLVYGGLVYGGWQAGTRLTIRVAATLPGLAEPTLSLGLFGTSVALAVASPDPVEPDVWTLTFDVPDELAGRYLQLRLEPPGDLAAALDYRVTLEAE